MEIVPVTPEAIAEAIVILEEGGTVAHATETCYGLACDLQNSRAVKRLFTMKKRPDNMPVSGLFASLEQAQVYTEWSSQAISLADEHLPGPLTLVLPIKPECIGELFPCLTPDGDPTLGVRVSPDEVAMELAQQYGRPLTTTSANVHGLPNPFSAQEVADQYADQTDKPDLILDSGSCDSDTASTVIALIDGELKVLREGLVKID